MGQWGCHQSILTWKTSLLYFCLIQPIYRWCNGDLVCFTRQMLVRVWVIYAKWDYSRFSYLATSWRLSRSQITLNCLKLIQLLSNRRQNGRFFFSFFSFLCFFLNARGEDELIGCWLFVILNLHFCLILTKKANWKNYSNSSKSINNNLVLILFFKFWIHFVHINSTRCWCWRSGYDEVFFAFLNSHKCIKRLLNNNKLNYHARILFYFIHFRHTH